MKSRHNDDLASHRYSFTLSFENCEVYPDWKNGIINNKQSSSNEFETNIQVYSFDRKSKVHKKSIKFTEAIYDCDVKRNITFTIITNHESVWKSTCIQLFLNSYIEKVKPK